MDGSVEVETQRLKIWKALCYGEPFVSPIKSADLGPLTPASDLRPTL